MKLVSWIGMLLTGAASRIEAQAAAQPREPLAYPTEMQVGESVVALRLLEPGDRDAILRFARALPEEDLLFLRRDITRDEEVDAWLRDAEDGLSETVIALADDAMVGYAAVSSDRLSWTRHIAELRVLIAPAFRGQGLGRLLTAQAFSLARQRGARKVIAQMTVEQHAARRAFERMGFTSEAVLHGQVIDREGRLHDLRIMSIDVDAFQRRVDLVRAQFEAQSHSL